MREFIRVWREEYRNIFGDKGVLMIFFGAIFFYSIFYPLPYANEVLKDAPLAVVDLDHSSLSRQLTRMVDAHESTRVAAQAASQREAEQLFFARKTHGILIIPHEFERTILRKEQGSVAVYSDASYFLLYQQVMTGVAVATGTLSAGIEIKRMQAGGFSEAGAKQLRDPLQLVAVALFNPSGGYASYVVPAVLVMILQQTLLIGIGMLAGTAREDRKQSPNTHPPTATFPRREKEPGMALSSSMFSANRPPIFPSICSTPPIILLFFPGSTIFRNALTLWSGTAGASIPPGGYISWVVTCNTLPPP